MATHIVAWNYKPEVTEEERARLNKERAEEFAKLIGVVPGMTSVRFIYDMMPGSTHSFMTISEHEYDESVQIYFDHPMHQELVAKYIRPYVQDRIVLNFK